MTKTVRRLGMLSYHSSPLVQPGQGDSGGMNVYVRELAGSLAQAGIDGTVFTRRWHHDLPDEVVVEPGFRVVHVDAGAPGLAKEDLPGVVGVYADRVLDHLRAEPVDLLHANYWLSGVAGHRLKHALDVPLAATFHTLGLVKSRGGDPEPPARIAAEREIVGCADVVCANTEAEATELVSLYDADPARIEVVPPGVDHAFFSPGERAGARAALALDLGDAPVVTFVGRIQPLKGLDVAVRSLAALEHDDAVLVAVGGPSGAAGAAHLVEVVALAEELGVRDRVRFVDARPHHLLSTYYRASDVVVVPSRSESFGLVALEAAACGTPVVASAVGGLTKLVDDGRSGLLVEGRDPVAWARCIDDILGDATLAERLAAGGIEVAADYRWSGTAARLRRVYADLAVREPVLCEAA